MRRGHAFFGFNLWDLGLALAAFDPAVNVVRAMPSTVVTDTELNVPALLVTLNCTTVPLATGFPFASRTRASISVSAPRWMMRKAPVWTSATNIP